MADDLSCICPQLSNIFWMQAAKSYAYHALLMLAVNALFNLYSNDLPVTRGQKFIYADDICLTIQGQYFSEL